MWEVQFDNDFSREFDDLPNAVRKAITAYAIALQERGPALGRPIADTLIGSSFPNMKELRPTVNKVEWRVAYAFDPHRRAILLAAGAKAGVNKGRFYGRLIALADSRYRAHLRDLEASKR